VGVQECLRCGGGATKLDKKLAKLEAYQRLQLKEILDLKVDAQRRELIEAFSKIASAPLPGERRGKEELKSSKIMEEKRKSELDKIFRIPPAKRL
jgi:hypothetical protein